MNAYDKFFSEHTVKIKLGRKKIHVKSIDEAQSLFLDYIIQNDISEKELKKNGELTVENELIAVFSINGRLWSTDEEEIFWRNEND